jgi:hypothetical protein
VRARFEEVLGYCEIMGQVACGIEGILSEASITDLLSRAVSVFQAKKESVNVQAKRKVCVMA